MNSIKIEFPADARLARAAADFMNTAADVLSNYVAPTVGIVGTASSETAHTATAETAHTEPAATSNVVSMFDTPTPAVPDTKTDKNGVPFNATFCSNGDQPFLTDGTWKMKRGADRDAFAAWYASARPTSGPAAQQPVAQQPVAQQPVAQQPVAQQPVAQAFQPAAQQPVDPMAAAMAAAQPVQQAPVATADPITAAQLVVWISERTREGRLDPERIALAFAQAGHNTSTLYALPPDQQPQAVANVLAQLKSVLA